MKKSRLSYLPLITVFIYLIVPLLATFLYSVSTKWNQTILPEGITFKWYTELFNDGAFTSAIIRSLLLSGGATILSVLFMVPAIFAIVVYAPRLEKGLQAIVLLTYAMPGVIMAVGLLRAYSGAGIPMVLVTVGAYFIGIMPYMYQGTRNSLRNIHASSLMEAAELLGATKVTAFRNIIVPNIMTGILVSALLSFSILFGEFVLANLLVGGSYETVQIYLYQQLKKSGHFSSAIVVCYFLFICILSSLVVTFTQRKKESF
ncbi:ABC transporter permease subunit [Rossellomorea aquimaris]|uniref:ABC transporter permease n=1 Tax=Rossellomorea aquimaris TaxID=189382 RepID=UPI001CD815FD|nr:ABC transporter permease subunit [Rossellomorea aquimaris]MCA1054390.1 ABC transporter permease subunit [Rossellomorea aquimaris]